MYLLMPNQMSVGRTPADRLMSTARWDEPAVRFNTVSLSPADVLHIPGLRFDGLVGYSPSRWPRMPSGWPKTPSSTGRPSSPTVLPPGGVLEHPGTIKDPARVREYWQSTFGGAATPQGRRPRRRHALHPHLVGLSPEQAQFLQTRKFQINEIARVFRIPPHMIGDPDKSSPSNIEQQSLEFVKYTLGPWGGALGTSHHQNPVRIPGETAFLRRIQPRRSPPRRLRLSHEWLRRRPTKRMDERAAIDLGFVDGLLTTQDPHQLEPAKPPTDPVMFSRRCSEQTLINHCTTPPVTAPAPAGRRVVDLYAALTCKPH